jgi:hypothetical protein
MWYGIGKSNALAMLKGKKKRKEKLQKKCEIFLEETILTQQEKLLSSNEKYHLILN